MRSIKTWPDVRLRKRVEKVKLINFLVEGVDYPKVKSMCRKLFDRKYSNYDTSEKLVCPRTTDAVQDVDMAMAIADKDIVNNFNFIFNYQSEHPNSLSSFKTVAQYAIYITDLKMIIMMKALEVNTDDRNTTIVTEAEIVTEMIEAEMIQMADQNMDEMKAVQGVMNVTIGANEETIEMIAITQTEIIKTINMAIRATMTMNMEMMVTTITTNPTTPIHARQEVEGIVEMDVDEAEMVDIKTTPMMMQEIAHVIHYVSSNSCNYNSLYKWLTSCNFVCLKILDCSYHEFLVVKTKHVWDDDQKHDIVHPRQFRTMEPSLHYTLVTRDGDTKRADYNNRNCWEDGAIFDEVFSVNIQSVAKNKLCGWLETAGATPNSVTMRKKDGTNYVSSFSLDPKEIIDSVKFTDIVHSLAFQFQNVVRLQYTDEKFLYLKLEFMNMVFCQTRKRIKDQISVVLPNLKQDGGEYEKRMSEVLDDFKGGAGENGKADVVAPARLSFAVGKDDIRQEHLSTYNSETKESAVISDAKKNHQFNYVDCAKSDVMVTSCYLKDNLKYAATVSQAAKHQHLSETNRWNTDNFRGEGFCFTKAGQPFLLTDPVKPIKHICRNGRFGCPNNCKNKGTFDWNAIPDWSAAFFMGEVAPKYSYIDRKKHAKAVRTFKRAFIRDVMMIPDTIDEETPKVEDEKPTTSKTTKSPISLKAILDAATPTETPNQTPTGNGASAPVSTKQYDDIAIKMATLQRANDEKEARLQAMTADLESLKNTVSEGDKNLKSQKEQVENLKINFVNHVKTTETKLEQSKAENTKMIDNTRVGLMNAVDRVGSQNKLNEKKIQFNETKSQVRTALLMNPGKVPEIITTVEQLQELGFIQVTDMATAAENLVEQGKALNKNKDHIASGKSLVSYEQCAIAADPSFGQSLQSVNRSKVAPESTIDSKLEYKTVQDQATFTGIFGFYDDLKADIKGIVDDSLKRQAEQRVDPNPPAKKPATITPPLSQNGLSVSKLNTIPKLRSIADSVDLFIQDNSTDQTDPEENTPSTTSEVTRKRKSSKELNSAEINDLSKQMQKKIKVNGEEKNIPEDVEMRASSPEYKTADEEDHERSEDVLLSSPNGTLEPNKSSSPKIEKTEIGRVNENYEDTEADVFAAGSREVGGALNLKPPQLPGEVDNVVDIKVAQVHNVIIKEYVELPSEKSQLATELNLEIDGVKRKVWTQSKELRQEAPKHYEQAAGDRWTSRWIQYCVPHQFQQLCATVVQTSEPILDSLDGLDRILYLEAKDHLKNLKYLLSNEIPKTIFHGIIQSQCEDPTMCWKLLDMFKPFPISTYMIEKFNQHVLAQLDKETEKVAIQILDVNMEQVMKKIAIPVFKNDNKASAILLRNFILEWATKDATPVDRKKLEKQQSIEHFTRSTKSGTSQPSPSAIERVTNCSFVNPHTRNRALIELILNFSSKDYNYLNSIILSLSTVTAKLFSHLSPLGKVRMESNKDNSIQYYPEADPNQEFPPDYLSQEISPKKGSKLNPLAPVFVPNIWKKNPYIESNTDHVSIHSASSTENDDRFHYLSVSSLSSNEPLEIESKGTFGSCPYGHNCILIEDQHFIDYFHPNNPEFVEIDQPLCDLGIQCPFTDDPEHSVRYKHPVIHESTLNDSDLTTDPQPKKSALIPANTKEGRILQKRYAIKNMLYPGVNCNDEFMLPDHCDRPEYNSKLRKEVLELNKAAILDPMVPIDDTLMPKKFETRKLFELRVQATREKREFLRNKHQGFVDQALYDSSNPTLRIKEKLEKAKKRKAIAKEKRKMHAHKRKDFRDLKIVYTNLNDPRRQITNVFYWYGQCDIIVLTELDIDIKFFHQIGRYNTNFTAYTHKGDKTVLNNGTVVYKIYAVILVNNRCNFDVKVKYNKVPFISLYVTLPSKNDHPLSFNITAFYKFHCGPKSRNLRLHSKLQVDDFFINRFFDIHKIQLKVPSILVGDGNCDLYDPRKQDSKYFAREIRSKFGDYKNEIGKRMTNEPNKRSLLNPTKNSCIDWFLTKDFPVSKIQIESGRQMVDNDGHACIMCTFDVPVLEQARLKTITVNHYPDKDIIFNHCFKVFQEHEEELERLFDTENLLRLQAKQNPDWEPPTHAGSYSAKVYELLNKVANETILEETKTVDLYRQRSSVSPFARESKRQLSEVENQIVQHSVLPASSGMLQKELEVVLKRYRQRDQRKLDTGKEDWEKLHENDIFKLHQKFSANMKLVRDKSYTFGCDKIGHNFVSLQEQEEIPDIDVELWDDVTNKFDPALCDLKIKGKDRSDSITHIIAGLKLNTTSTGTKLCRKFLAGVPRNLIGHHLIRSIRLDTELGVYNQDGKTNKLIKLAKAGKDLSKLDGYRCIQVPKVCAQIGDCFLIQNFTKSLIQNNCISDAQNGFRPHYSCSTATARIFDAINHNGSKKSILVFIDFRNAFGCVNHKLLVKQIAKVASKGVTRLIKDQLTGRFIVVHEDGSQSEPFPIPDVGVPQGSNGGPIYYSIYAEIILSFLLKYKDIVTILFADDTCLRICGDSYHEALAKAEEILQKMAEACNRIGLGINSDKSEFLLVGKSKEDLFIKYTLNGKEYKISQKNSVRYLGFHFDAYLAYTEHFGKIMQRLYHYRPLICRMIKVGNFRENRRFARQLLYGLLQYGMEVIPLGTDTDYGNLNLAIVSAACDILNIKRCSNNKKVAHSSIFNLFRWLESSNIHKLAILRFTNRVLLENRPADIAARLRSVLVYESDHRPFIAIDATDLLSKDRIIAERRFWKADVPLLKVNPIAAPQYPQLYPYNLNKVLEDLPHKSRCQLGSWAFFHKIKSHYENLCQHARYLTSATCKFCRRRDAMIQYHSELVQPIHKNQPGKCMGIFSYHYNRNPNPTWAHMLHSWQKVLKNVSKELNRKLQSINFIKPVHLRPSLK